MGRCFQLRGRPHQDLDTARSETQIYAYLGSSLPPACPIGAIKGSRWLPHVPLLSLAFSLYTIVSHRTRESLLVEMIHLLGTHDLLLVAPSQPEVSFCRPRLPLLSCTPIVAGAGETRWDDLKVERKWVEGLQRREGT